MKELRGRVGVVTGGSGLGRSIALELAREGMHVAIGSLNLDTAEATAADARALGVRATAEQLDVSDREAVFRFADHVFDAHGQVDLLCNNAGITTFKAITDVTADDWDWVNAVNLWGTLWATEAFLPRMLTQGTPGHIVNLSSMGGALGLLRQVPYGGAKAAVIGLSEGLRADLADRGIEVTVVVPGEVRTGMGHAGKLRPSRFGPPDPPDPVVTAALRDGGLDPDDVATLVVRAVKAGRRYVLTGAPWRERIERRRERILAGFDWVAAERQRPGSLQDG